ncbi:hypothetical protein BT96DRAFT_124602 [Gymnopus androsaceus JB14]|uniref:Nuclear speckle splicing regulatory protein 1 N-terminal domain-containing protein n=1 Tax=Gymnopus androsaceus JB14 TaxID=1447944 RepID=A0A6A4HE49_9AGAR|nr:hypothetical protein BT96DRAFT_124602 [Gymnopus androsaceus JB14]
MPNEMMEVCMQLCHIRSCPSFPSPSTSPKLRHLQLHLLNNLQPFLPLTKMRQSMLHPLQALPLPAEMSLPTKKFLAQNVLTSKKLKKQMEEEKKVDSTVYEYDEVWDKMQQAKQTQKEAKETDLKNPKPKYIHNLLISAETRRLDHLRAEEKLMQLERLREGDEFADKESFVTQRTKTRWKKSAKRKRRRTREKVGKN